MSSVQPQNCHAQWVELRERIQSAVERVGSSGQYILGKEVARFERSLAKYLGIPFVIGCGNGLDALEIALRIIDVKPGEKILTTPISAFATTLSILKVGGSPVFCDVDENGLMDLNCAEEIVSKEGIRILLPVHLYGVSLDLDRLQHIQDKYGVEIIEDCAQAVGAKFNAKVVGSVGRLACTSFYPTKNLGCLGDGGAVLCHSENDAHAAMMIRDYGQSEKFVHSRIGLNSRLDELHAAILNDALLPKLDEYTRARQYVANEYLEKISNDLVRLPWVYPKSEPVWHIFPVFVQSDREEFRKFLAEKGIHTSVHYPIPITEQKALLTYANGFKSWTDSGAKRLASSEVSLPIHPFMTSEEIESVVKACNGWNV